MCKSLALLLVFVSLCSAAEVELMQNLDGDLSFTGDIAEQSKTKLMALVDQIGRGPVKTLMYSIGAGSDILYYPTQVASVWGWRKTKYDDTAAWKTRIDRCRAAQAAGLDAPFIAGSRARELGMRFVPSYRMNDAHYCSDPLNYPLTGRFWIEHQEMTIGKSPVSGYDAYAHLLDYSRAEVRAYRLAVIFEAIDRYAPLMDGFELDFNRFQIFFAPGKVEDGAPLITEMVRQVRRKLQETASRVGRPMELVVRVPPALHNCRWSGLEVGKWMREKMVDVVIPAQVMTLSHDMPLEEFVAIAGRSGCRVVGSIYGRASYNWPFSGEHSEKSYAMEVKREPTAEQVRGAAMNQLQQGASGFQLYNFNYFKTGDGFLDAVWKDLAEPGRIVSEDRRYQITPGFFNDREDTYEYRKQIPVTLTPDNNAVFRLLIGENLAAALTPPKVVALRLGFFGANQDYRKLAITVELNGWVIHTGPASDQLVVTRGKRHGNGSHPPPTEAYVQWPIADLAIVRKGWNDLRITLVSPAIPALQLVEAEIGVIAR